MHPHSWPESLALAAGQIKSFMFAEPMQVRIVRGCVWLTVSGMPDDYWMAGGEFIDVPAQRHIVIEAYKTDSMLGFVRMMHDVPGSAIDQNSSLHGKLAHGAVVAAIKG